MRPIPIPAHVSAALPGYRSVVVAAPSGDLTDPDVAPVETLVPDADTARRDGAHYRSHWTLDLREVAALIAGGTVELVMWTPQLPVHSMAVWPPEQPNDNRIASLTPADWREVLGSIETSHADRCIPEDSCRCLPILRELAAMLDLPREE